MLRSFFKKGDGPAWEPSPKSLFFLSTEAELLDNVTVSLDVGLLEIIQHLTSFTYEAEKAAPCDVVLLVFLYMLREVSDTVGE